MTLRGKTWEVLGKIWYAALTERLRPEADFRDFVQATVDIAGELYGNGGHVQRVIAAAWSDVGLFPAVVGCASTHPEIKRPRDRVAAITRLPKSRRRPAR